MEGSRILLSGISGQIGRALSQVLPQFGSVLATQRSVGPNLGVPTAAASLDNYRSYEWLFSHFRPTLFVHPAAYTKVDLAEKQEAEMAWKINAESTEFLADLCRKHNCAMIYFSTDYVYPGTGERSWKESDATGPLNWYGKTKLQGEQHIIDADVKYMIFRISWIYDVIGQNFLRTMLNLFRTRKEISVVGDQIGTPTSANFVAKSVATILHRSKHQNIEDFIGERSGVYNLAPAGFTSWHGFAKQIHALAGENLMIEKINEIRSEDYPTAAPRPKNSRLDTTKVVQNFSLQMPQWQTLLQECFAS